MPRYLNTTGRDSLAIAVCGRCKLKVAYDDLRQDPNTKNWYCEKCVDLYDPYRLPPRRTEKISLHHPRPDEPLEMPQEEV